MLAKRGPQPREWVELRTTITPEQDRALASLVALSGVSKATFVRTALAEMLARAGVLDPDSVTDVPVTPTGGRSLVTNRKESR